MMLHKIKMRGNLGHQYREVGWFCLGEKEDFFKGTGLLDLCWDCNDGFESGRANVTHRIGKRDWHPLLEDQMCGRALSVCTPCCVPLSVFQEDVRLAVARGLLPMGKSHHWGSPPLDSLQKKPAGLRTQNPGAVSSAQRLSGTLISRLSLKRWTVQISSCAC